MTAQTNIVLPESMNITRVFEFHQKLSEEIDSGDTVVFDAAGVERADTAFLQMLTAFCIDAPSRNITVEWQQPSASLVESAEMLGLQEQLQLKQ